MDINLMKQKLELKYFNSVLKSTPTDNVNYPWIKSHYESLYDKYLNDKDKTSETLTEKKSETQLNIEYPLQYFSDESFYKKPWVKLNPIHKILKIKEFVNNLHINSEKEREKLKDELVDLVKIKALHKKDKVEYDENSGKIKSLCNLQCKDGKYSYVM